MTQFHILIERHLLNLAMSRVHGAMAERAVAHVGLNARLGKLFVAAADQSLAIFNNLPCEILAEGVIFVPARLFAELSRELPEGKIELRRESHNLVVTAGTHGEFTMRLPLIEEATWRDPPKVQYENSAEFPVGKLSYMIEQVASCVTVDSPRDYANVAYMHRPQGGDKAILRLVGTDSYRLSFCDVRLDMGDRFLKDGISLTKRALQELERLSSEGFEKVKLSVSDDQTTLVAEVPDYQIFIRLSAVKYPNYVNAVPDFKQHGVLMSTGLMKNVAKRVLLAADKSRVLQLSFSDSSLTLSSKNTGNSEGKERIALEGYHGGRCDLSINGRYLTDIFNVTGAERMAIQFKEPEEPVILSPYGEPVDCITKHILVPISGGAEHRA